MGVQFIATNNHTRARFRHFPSLNRIEAAPIDVMALHGWDFL